MNMQENHSQSNILRKGSFLHSKQMNPIDFALGHMLNDDEKRMKGAAGIMIEKMPTKEHREISECLKLADFSFLLIFKLYGKDTTGIAMHFANMAAKFEIEMRNIGFNQ